MKLNTDQVMVEFLIGRHHFLSNWQHTMQEIRQNNFVVILYMVFPVVTYGYESWIIKKAQHQRIDAFELWGCKKTLESLLDSKEIKLVNPKGNQS